MNLTRKTYETRHQKVVDFLIGFVGWFILNAVLAGIAVGLFVALDSVSPDLYYSDAYTNLVSLVSFIVTCLPLLINIGAMIYFAFTRHWIALGALAAFATSLIVILLLGLIVGVVCFTILSGYSG